MTDDNGKEYYKLAMTQIKKNENDYDESDDENEILEADPDPSYYEEMDREGQLGFQNENNIEKPDIQKIYEEHKISGLELKKSFEEHGVKNSTILAVIAAPESYDNMKQIYELTNVNELNPDKNIADGKANNIKAGKMQHSCKFPCIYVL